MPTRKTPGRSRYVGFTSRVACVGVVAVVLVVSLLVVFLLSSIRAPNTQAHPSIGTRSVQQLREHFSELQTLDGNTVVLKQPQDKPPDPLLPTAEEMHRPRCSTHDKHAMLGAPPCADPDPEIPTANGNAKVALMFLVKTTIPTEPIWAAFFASAAELTLRKGIPATAPKPIELLPPDEPTQEELGTKCWAHGGLFAPFGVPPREKYEGEVPPVISNVTGWLQENCFADMTPRQHYELQDLFTVYVHRRPGAEELDQNSLFYKRDIKNRIRAEFAQPSLVAALRLLLAEALLDTRNSMFVLVSESCIPLHHPALFYAQMMAESHISRVGNGAYNLQRWFHLMSTSHLRGQHFQKSDQWLTLTRVHAQLVSSDTHVWSQFQRYCRTQMACWQPSRFYGHVCISDEHYVPTLLAAHDLDEQRDLIGVTTFTDWMSEQGSWHPKTFHPGNALEDIYTMRRRSLSSGCPKLPHKSLRSAASVFLHTPICNSAGDKIMPLRGRNYREPNGGPVASHRRRLLTSEASDSPVDTPDISHDLSDSWPQVSGSTVGTHRVLQSTDRNDMLQSSKLGDDLISSGRSLLEDSVSTGGISGGAARHLVAVPEFGLEHEKSHWGKAQTLRDIMRGNLNHTGWLSGFEPMQMHCPLFGRRIEWLAVSEFAALAWRCDGLGFAWECLHAD